MPIDDLQSKGDLRRFIEAELRRPGVVPSGPPSVSVRKNGVPSDADFPATPGDGVLGYDREAGTLYIRDEGEWRAV